MMFEIKYGDQGEIIPVGRLDASRVDEATSFLETVTTSKVVDLTRLDYISSVGIGLLVATQKRLAEAGEKLKLINANESVRSVFHFAGLDAIFEFD